MVKAVLISYIYGVKLHSASNLQTNLQSNERMLNLKSGLA